MKVRYFISLMFMVVVFIFICFASGISYYLTFFDLPSALVVIIFPLIFMWILHGWKDVRSAFIVLGKKNPDKKDLINAKSFFETYGKTVFSIAIIAFVLSFIAIMRHLEDAAALAPNIAIASIVLLYAGIINILIIIPYKIIISKKMLEMES